MQRLLKFGSKIIQSISLVGQAVGLPLQDWVVFGWVNFLILLTFMDKVTYRLDIIQFLEIGETSYILGSHHPRALQELGFDLVLVERGGGLSPLL